MAKILDPDAEMRKINAADDTLKQKYKTIADLENKLLLLVAAPNVDNNRTELAQSKEKPIASAESSACGNPNPQEMSAPVARYFKLTDAEYRPSSKDRAEARKIYRVHSKEIVAEISKRTGHKASRVDGNSDESTANRTKVDPKDQEKYDAWQALRASAEGKPSTAANAASTAARRYLTQNSESINRVIAATRAN